MPINWKAFTNKVESWAETESNTVNYDFRVEFIDDNTIRIEGNKGNKTYRIKYTKRDYVAARKSHGDDEILPTLFQLIKDKFKARGPWAGTW